MQRNFDQDDLQAPLAEINMTPLVDVMLVLLVIFLVTAPMLNNSISLKLPSETASDLKNQKAIAISITKSGKYFLDKKEYTKEGIEEKLKIIAQNNPKQKIHLRADTEVSYGKVSHILASAQKHGLSNIGFITQPK